MVKCAKCGYLAQHIFRGSIPQGFIDVEEAPRETGELPGKPLSLAFHSANTPDLTPEKLDGDRFPTCFSRAFNLRQEIEKRHSEMQKDKKDASFASAVKDVIQADRVCKQFVEWQRGFTPKEHREMIDREKMLKWQAGREDADRKWRVTQDKKLVIIAGGFTVLGAVIGALIAIFH